MVTNSVQILLVLAVLVNSVSCTNLFRGGVDAVCTSKGCTCPPDKPLGHPLFRCHDSTKTSCTTIGDPIIYSFSRPAFVHFGLPCVYSVTRYESSFGKGRAKRHLSEFLPQLGIIETIKSSLCKKKLNPNRCRVDVKARNGFSTQGTSSVDLLTVTIEFNTGRKTEFAEVTLGQDGATVSVNGGPTQVVQSYKILSVGDEKIEVYYSNSSECWIARAPSCGDTDINYRSFKHENQHPRSGFSITASKDSDFSDSVFPSQLCHQPGSGKVFSDYKLKEAINDTQLAVLYGFFSNPLCGGQPADLSACSSLFTNAIKWGIKVKRIVIVCGPILTEFRTCAKKHRLDPIEYFNKCGDAVALGNQKLADLVQAVLAAKCSGVRRFPCS